MYEYQATIARVVDGDTLDLLVDVGFSIHIDQRVRLLGVNAPEHNTPEGKAATAFVNAWLDRHGRAVTVRTVHDKREKYGRILAVLTVGSEELNRDLVASGHAVAYSGGKR